MRFVLAALLFAALAWSQQQRINLTGTLSRAMAIGGETTGWSIQLDSPLTIDGKQFTSFEISYKNPAALEQLNHQHVRATGRLAHRQGVETDTRPVLEISSIRKAEPAQSESDLTGSEWLLEDLAGSGVIDNAQATLTFPEQGRVAGRASCNRFSGSVEIGGTSIKFGPLISTRMACPEAVMNQEDKYLKALQSVDRFERNGSSLLLYSKGSDKPLRFRLQEHAR